MGCWNETCMISHLPILGGEKCTGVLLLEQKNPNIRFNPMSYYIALAAIQGEYDEYGRLENIDPVEASALLSAFSCLTLVTTDDCNDKLRNFTPSTIGEFMAAISDNRVVVHDKRGPTALHLVFIKERMASLVNIGEDRCLLDDAFKHGAKFPLYTLMNTLAGGRWHPAMSPFLTAYVAADEEAAYRSTEQILALTRLLTHLRMGWHVPCGRGNQESVYEDMRHFADAYREELDSIDMDLGDV